MSMLICPLRLIPRRALGMLLRALLAVCLLGAVGGAFAAEGLVIQHEGVIESYAENTLMVQAPAAGQLTVTVRDEYSVFRTMRQVVPAGESVIQWDGLRDDGQRLGIYNGMYTLDAELVCPDGTSYRASAQAEGRSRQALLYVLPSSETLYWTGERWFAEAGAVKGGNVIMTVAAAQSPDQILLTRRYTLTEKGVGRLQWSGSVNGGKAAPGRYLLRYWAEENPEKTLSLEITVARSAPPAVPVAVTGPVMPEAGVDDAALWALLRKPRVVANVPNTGRQKIYERPSRESAVLGTLFGQTQGVELLAIEDGWARVHAWQHEKVIPVTGYVPLKALKTVAPNGPYGLVIDQKTQTLTLYENGARVTVIPVSTGLGTTAEPYRKTAPGAFLTDEHIGAFTSEGANYAFPIRYDGNNFLHQLGYRVRDRHADYSVQRRLLGTASSHGCVRLPDHPVNDSGVDAFWLWTHLPWHTPILILDE